MSNSRQKFRFGAFELDVAAYELRRNGRPIRLERQPMDVLRLDKAYAARDVHLIFLPVDPKWDPYRGDSRFEALLARCGFTRNTSLSLQ